MTDEVVKVLQGSPWSIRILTIARDVTTGQPGIVAVVLQMLGQNDPTRSVTVKFTGVTDLAFNQASSNLAIVPEIVSLRERGWEVPYKFADVGNDSLHFMFEDAEVASTVQHTGGA